MRAFIRLIAALGLLAYGGFCERCDQYSGCRFDCLLCRKSMRAANRAQWRCSEGTQPSAEDAEGAEADTLLKIGKCDRGAAEGWPVASRAEARFAAGRGQQDGP